MALIICPECRQQVSDKAVACPKCAFPISSLRTDGVVKIKLMPSNVVYGFVDAHRNDHAKIFSDTGELLWNGKMCQVASFTIQKSMEIRLEFESFWGSVFRKFSAFVEADKKYQLMVSKRNLFNNWEALLNEVDVIDSE